jgi:2,3-diketo-5-methylthio-1-phosphopentane phosphatase
MSERYDIFIDFDGTMTVNDVGYELFKNMTDGKTEALVREYRDGRINSLQCLSGECSIWDECPPEENVIVDFLGGQLIRDDFKEFLTFLSHFSISPIILSEGFDFYIVGILEANGLKHLRRITNSAALNNGALIPAFPYYDEGCGQCSNCKGYHINQLKSPLNAAIFIGDGRSDFHAAEAADIVFARSDLRELLSSKKRPYYTFDCFRDVMSHLDAIF